MAETVKKEAQITYSGVKRRGDRKADGNFIGADVS